MAHESTKTVVFIVFLFGGGVSCSTLSSRCRKITFAERLGKYPDALELITDKSPKYSLVFHSQNRRATSGTQCLQTLNFAVNRETWLTTVTYAYYSVSYGMPVIGYTYISTKKHNGTFLSDDTIVVYLDITGQGTGGTLWQVLESEIIYNDEYCVFMKSQRLGLQVWARTTYLKQSKEVPYLCTFLYEMCGAKEKHFVYNFTTCENFDPK
uniref:Putative lipocalin n=1 Tax=Ixodes ricinus TaxID=34613 RepID=A0A6B0V393_IXORI